MTDKHQEIAFIRELLKGKPEEYIQEAEYNFTEYLKVCKDIYERLERKGRLNEI